MKAELGAEALTQAHSFLRAAGDQLRGAIALGADALAPVGEIACGGVREQRPLIPRLRADDSPTFCRSLNRDSPRNFLHDES